MARGLRKATPLQKKRSPMRWGQQAKTRDALHEGREDLEDSLSDFMDKTKNPIANAYAGAQNTFANVGANNRILGMENPYAGMSNPMMGMQTQFENKMEDVGVDTKAAELAQRQFQQNQSSQLEAMKQMGMTGGNVQAMANASLKQSAQSRADIGKQEREGNIMAKKGAQQVQQMEAQAKEKKMKAGFEVDKMIRKGQFDVDKLIGATELDIDKVTAEGAWKQQMATMGGEADRQNLELQRQQGGLAVQAGIMESLGGEQASTPWYSSDRKLKHNITLVGKSVSGLNIYNFEYKNSKFGEGVWQGVMSNEVPNEVVVKHNDGYDMVDYSKIDVDFVKIKN
tara:strand:- start:5955 stop:6974 length:1020 start_codon:yes stop_codon:yes gene_type:complete